MISGAATAQEHFDVLLYEDAGGNLAAGGSDVDTAEAFPNQNVFEAELLGDTLLPTPTFVGDEPGFFSYSDTAVGGPPVGFPAGADNLPGSADVRLNFRVEPTLGLSFARWNDGLGMFEAPGAGESIMLDTLLDPGGSIDGTSEVLNLLLGPTSATGALDDHPDYELSTAAGTGVFLGYGDASVDGFGAPTNPFWIVFGTIDECEETETCNAMQEAFNVSIEEQIEAAILYTETVLVPEPSTALLVGLGMLAMAGRRRAQRA
ncbi:MAG: PEP-CTERM sorting domain-containing protein [Myxococcota bacterium]